MRGGGGGIQTRLGLLFDVELEGLSKITVLQDKLKGLGKGMGDKGATIRAMNKELKELRRTKLGNIQAELKKAMNPTRTTKFTQGLKVAKNAMKSFRMEFLGIMFAGMALQRLFTSIIKSTTATFTKIIESSNISGTAIQRLGAHWEYLKFTIGSVMNNALGPLMPMITRLITRFSEWSQKHPKLVGWIIILGAAIGMLLFVFGSIALALNSFVSFAKGPFGKGIGMMVKGLKKLIVGNFGLTSLKGLIVKVTAKWEAMVATMKMGKKGSMGVTGLLKSLGTVAVVIAAIVALWHIWTKASASATDKIFASIMVIAVAAAIVAAIFGLWPIALVAVLVALLASIYIFREQLKEGLRGWSLIFKKEFARIKYLWKALWGDRKGMADAERDMMDIRKELRLLAFDVQNTDAAFKEKWGFGNIVDQLKIPELASEVEDEIGGLELETTNTVPVEKVIDLTVNVDATGAGNIDNATLAQLADDIASKLTKEVNQYS